MQVNDKVRVLTTGGLFGHYFDKGEVVTVEGVRVYPDYTAVDCVSEDGKQQSLPIGEVELITQRVSGEIKPKATRYMYVITDEDGYIDATPDRDEARETKALFGGKQAGVIITAYAPVKEIR